MKKFFEIVFPMLLIAAMNHLNVINAVEAIDNKSNYEEVEAVDYLNNSATLALSVVVFLPTMIGTSRFHSIFQVNDLYISTIFVALALSALPYAVFESTVPAKVGTYLFWASQWIYDFGGLSRPMKPRAVITFWMMLEAELIPNKSSNPHQMQM
jgi:hypothetical protein